jgi:tetratricopeptide (TPR) repeat protein
MKIVKHKFFNPIVKIINTQLNFQSEDEFSRDAAEGFQLFPGNKKRMLRIRLKLKILVVKTVWLALSVPIKAVAITTMVAGATTGLVFINTIRPSFQLTKHNHSSTGQLFLNTDIPISQHAPLENMNSDIITVKNIHYYNSAKHQTSHNDITPIRIIYSKSLDVPVLSPINIPYSSFPAIYFGSNKFYDFSSLYEHNNPLIIPTLTGLEAKYENKNAVRLHEAAFITDTIGYLAFLEKIALSIETSQLKEALRLTDILLNQRPDDENGMYYKGFILYKLGRYETSFSFFHHCEHSAFRTFYHESRLHRLYLLTRSGENDEALALIENMISEQSPYSEIAESMRIEIIKGKSP